MHSAWMRISVVNFAIMTAFFGGSACHPSAEETIPPARQVSSQTSSLMQSEPDGALWGGAGAMKAGRLLHTVTRLIDGRVLAVGGYTRSAELFNPTTERWVSTRDTLNTHRSGTATLLQDGRVLIASAGASEWDSSITAELYDPITEKWSATGGLLTPRFHHTAVLLLDGRVLVLGGSNSEYGGTVLASAEIYEPTRGIWSATAPMGSARLHHTATLLSDGKVLVTGGFDSTGMPLRFAEIFNPVAGSWTRVGNMTTPRARHSATILLNGKVIVTGGGGTDWQSSSSSEVFDPALNSWQAAASMATPRRSHSATLLPTGHILVVGGFHEHTGILSTAESYDPDAGVWRPAGDMETGRYRHASTLLANGRVLVAGGFSNGDQGSAEIFAPYFETLLASGDDWDLLHIAGVMDETGTPFTSNLYVLQSEAGIQQAPIPENIRADIANSDSTTDTAYVVSQSVVDEIVLSESQGALTPALEAIAEPLDPEGASPSGLFKRCSDSLASPGKTINLNKSFKADEHNLDNRTSPNPGNSSIGSSHVGGNMSGTIRGEVQVRLRRFRLFKWCIPYGVRFDHARIHGNVLVNSGATVDANLSFNRNLWQWDLKRTRLFSLNFALGPIPVRILVDLPMRAALDMHSSITGKMTYTGLHTVSGRFDYICTFKRCDGYSSLDVNSSGESPSAAYSVTARIKAELYLQAAFRASLYSPYVAYGWVGVKPSLNGDLWAYYGNDCGVASAPSDVLTAAAFDLDFDLQLQASAGVLRRKKKWFDADWTLYGKNFHIWFQHFGDSDVFKPILRGPTEVPVASVAQFNIKPRACWPYGDRVEYLLDWGDGMTVEPKGSPNEWVPVGHSWGQAGEKAINLTAIRDGHGRDFGKTAHGRIQVVGSTGTWTSWLNRDEPGGSGDWETLADFPVSSVCNGAAPAGIECRTADGGIDWSLAGEAYTCAPTIGGVCINTDQSDSECLDYEVRFLCP